MNEDELRAAGIHPALQRHRQRLADRIDAEQLIGAGCVDVRYLSGGTATISAEHHDVFRQYGGRVEDK